MKRLIRLALAGIIVGIFSVGIATPAHAVDICKGAPAPQPPRAGMAGLLTLPPGQPVTGDPFTDPRIPISDVYGTTWRFTLFDMGCSPNALTDPVAVIGTSQANSLLDMAGLNLAVLNLLERMAKDTGVGWFGDWAGKTAEALRPIIMGGTSPQGRMVGLMSVALIVTALWVAWRAKKAKLSEVGRTVAIVLVCIGLSTYSMLSPGLASRGADSLTRQAATIGGSAFNASLTDGVTRNAVYRAWLAGNFGDPDSAVAKKYGPPVFKSTRYTWTEWASVQNNPDARQKMDEKKAADFKGLAGELKKENPTAYGFLQGHGDRLGPAVFANLAGALMGLFALIAYTMILIGRIVMQILVVAAPVAAVLGLLPKGDRALMRMWDLFVAALWAVFKFSLAAGLMTTVLGLLSTLDPVSSLVWMTVVTIAALVVLKPFHAFKTMTPGLDPNRKYLKELAGIGVKLGLAAVTGGVAGAVTAAAVTDDDGPGRPPVQVGDLTVDKPAPQRVNLQSPPPLPAPRFEQLPGTTRHVAIEPAPAVSERLALTTGPTQPPALPGAVSAPAPLAPGLPQAPALPARDTPSPERPGLPAATDPLEVTVTQLHTTDPAVITVQGEIIHTDHTIYQRPDLGEIYDAEIVEGPVLTGRDLGSDQPAGELVLYRSPQMA